MDLKDKNYLFLILVHVAVGCIISAFPFAASLYGYLIIFGSIYFIIKTRNRNYETLYASAYIIGSEVFLRMTNGNPNHEFAKYSLVLFSILGMFYNGFSKNAVSYWIFLLLLIPGLIIGSNELNSETNIRTTLSFNISGPLSLGITSIYCYRKKMKFSELNNLLLLMGLPIISCVTYLFFYSTSIQDSLNGTGSNVDLSGGFGPNQVATALGLGMFIFVSRIILNSKSKIILLTNIILASYIAYRGMITFSRGGMITGLVMIMLLVGVIFIHSKKRSKFKISLILGFIIFAMVLVWSFTSVQTGGLIDKRYANKDAGGRVKKNNLTGRAEISEKELDLFLDNPYFGVGVGRGAELRYVQTNDFSASHNELTRLLAEHGLLGCLSLLILIVTPLFLLKNNQQHIFLFSFLVFWLLTINHAAMRTAAPSFVYALSLLAISFDAD